MSQCLRVLSNVITPILKEVKYGKDKADIPEEGLEKFWAKYPSNGSQTVCEQGRWLVAKNKAIMLYHVDRGR
jgi:hypothetical protein